MPNRKKLVGWYRLRSGGLYHGSIPVGVKEVSAKTAETEIRKSSGTPVTSQSSSGDPNGSDGNA